MSLLGWIGVVLIVLWLLGWLVFKIASGLIHLVLIIGLALVVWGLIRRGANAVRQS